MSDIFANIGNWLSSTQGQDITKLGTAGGGFLQNWLASRQANQKQQFVQDLITNPAKFNALVAQTEQPLNQGLVQDITRQTDAYGAERGFGSSPAIMKDILAQALAPAEMQNQQTAINSLLQRLGIYSGQPTMKPVDLTSIFKALSMAQQPSVQGQTPSQPSGANLPPDIFNLSGPLPTPSVDVGDPTPTAFYGGDTGGFGG